MGSLLVVAVFAGSETPFPARELSAKHLVGTWELVSGDTSVLKLGGSATTEYRADGTFTSEVRTPFAHRSTTGKYTVKNAVMRYDYLSGNGFETSKIDILIFKDGRVYFKDQIIGEAWSIKRRTSKL